MKDCIFTVNTPDGPVTYTYNGLREYLMTPANLNYLAPRMGTGAAVTPPAKTRQKTERAPKTTPPVTQTKAPQQAGDNGPEPAEGVTITIGTRAEVNQAQPQVRFVIMAKTNFYTLWAAFRQPNGTYTHYFVRNLATEPEKAKAIATDFVRRIAAGQEKGQAFSSDRMQIDTDRYKSFGLDTETWTASELLELSRGPSIPIGEQEVKFGKRYANQGLLIKDLFATDEDYAMWAANNLSGSLESIGRYLRSRPEYILAKQAANAAMTEALSAANLAVLGKVKMTAMAGDGVIELGGATFGSKEIIKEAGGRFYNGTWTITPDKFPALIDRLQGVSTAPRRQRRVVRDLDSDSSIAELRQSADSRPDRSGLDRPLGEYVGNDTQSLLKRGINFGIPAEIIDEQIEDVAKIRQAYERKSGMFLLASEPGSGKTYVLGAAIRELRQAGAKKITYVTLREELISQIKSDLEAFGIEDVEFITYPGMRQAGSQKTDVLIFDEAHSVKNVGEGKAGSQQAQAAEQWIQRSEFTIFSTATPFENPVQAAYLEPTGIFDPIGGVTRFQQAYGAVTEKIFVNGREMKIRVWLRNEKSNEDALAAREYLRREGVFTSRPTRLPPDMVDARMTKVAVAEEWERRYTALIQAAVQAKLDDASILARMWMTNFQKRILEAAKLEVAIQEAKEALKRGRNPIIFVETKAATEKDIPDLIAKEEAYQAAVARTKRGDKRPQRADFELPPEGVVDVLKEYMLATGDELIAIPPAEQVIADALGKDNVAIFTGTVSAGKADKNLTAWRNGEKKVLVATMAKGGTGLSLHDRIGDHPTTQIVVNLPWTATQVKQVAQRNARYGLRSKAEIIWLFAENIPFDRILAGRVGGRMADMGASVYGDTIKEAQQLEDWAMADLSFNDLAATTTPPVEKKSAPKKLLQEQTAAPILQGAKKAAPEQIEGTRPSSREAERTDTSGRLADLVDRMYALANETPRPTSAAEVKAFMRKAAEITEPLSIRIRALIANIREAIEEDAPAEILAAKRADLRAMDYRLTVISDEVREIAVKHLAADKPADIKWHTRGGALAPSGIASLVNTGMKQFQALVGDHPDISGKSIPVHYNALIERAFYLDPTPRDPLGYITIGQTVEPHVMAHELGHWLEISSPYAAQRIKEFLRRRTAGNRVQSLHDIEDKGYGPEEITLVDKFYHPYIGRIYAKGGMKPKVGDLAEDLDWDKAIVGSEVLSVGIEHMITNPVRMASLDFDFFETVYDVIRYRGESESTEAAPEEQ